MKVRPLSDRIIVQRLQTGEELVGGIIIPDSAKEKPLPGESPSGDHPGPKKSKK